MKILVVAKGEEVKVENYSLVNIAVFKNGKGFKTNLVRD